MKLGFLPQVVQFVKDSWVITLRSDLAVFANREKYLKLKVPRGNFIAQRLLFNSSGDLF